MNGLNEMVRNFTASALDITSEWGHGFACRVLDHVRARMVQFQEETGHLYNLEATPTEGTTYRFAREDRKRFPGVLQAGTAELPYYTNSSQLPVGFTDDPFEAPERQEELQSKYTGGTVPRRLAEVLPLVDWVAMDAKAPFDDHERVTRVRGSARRARQSYALIRASGVAREFHTVAGG